jgi:hypothetical protein
MARSIDVHPRLMSEGRVSRRLRRPLSSARTAVIGAIAVTLIVGTAVVVAGRGSQGSTSQLADVRAATAAFHNLDLAFAAGYEKFYLCTDQTGTGAMGQHFVKGALVEDPALDKLRPEVLVYEPRKDGGYQLVAVEYVVLKDAWHAANGSKAPRLFGRRLTLVPAGNRYGLPPFYEIHAWIWKGNPRGLFDDWNPKVSCRGQGDPA